MGSSDFFSIDIGRKTIKLASGKRHSENSGKIDLIGSIAFPDSISSAVPDKTKKDQLSILASVIKTLVDSSGVKTKQVVTAMPESEIFTKTLTLPVMDVNKMEEAIHWEAKQFIPFPIDQAQIDWMEIEQRATNDGRTLVDIIVIAAPVSVVEGYLELFEMAGLELIALEVKSVALARLVKFSYPQSNSSTMVIDIGAEGTDIAIVRNGKLAFSQSLSTGSNAFTKSIATDFGLQPLQAEQYKFVYGLATNQADGAKIYNSIKPIVDVIVTEVHKIISFIGSRTNFGTPNQIYLCGNGALLNGLPQYLQGALNIQVAMLNPVANLKIDNNMKNQSLLGYSVAIGLALKEE